MTRIARASNIVPVERKTLVQYSEVRLGLVRCVSPHDMDVVAAAVVVVVATACFCPSHFV